MAEATVLVALTLLVTALGHGLGRSRHRRAWLRRKLLSRGTPWAGAVLLAVAGAVLVAYPVRGEVPRRYADYLPDDGSGGPDHLLGPVLAAAAAGTAVLVLAAWGWLRLGSRPGRRGVVVRYLLTAAGGGLLLAGLAIAWMADRTEPPSSFGWYAYAPLTDHPAIQPGDTTAQAAQEAGIVLGGLGLAALTASVSFRVGRRETTA